MSVPPARKGSTRHGIQERWMEAMQRGDFATAWAATDEIELPRRQRCGRDLGRGELLWDGTPFEGRHVLVRCLNGLGDSVQFLRFVPEIHRVARSVTVALQPPLVPLFDAHLEYGSVRNGWTDDPWSGVDVEIEVMELAYALRMTPERLPRPPYLMPEVPPVEAGGPYWPPGDRPRVGFVWRSSNWDESRSLDPAMLEPLRCGCWDLFDLQQDVSAAERARLPFASVPLWPYTGAVLDLARALLGLDHVVAVDGMVAHLAGALGRPVSLLLKHEADWRWMRERSDTPWYPSMRLFRQPSPGDWQVPIEALAADLQQRLS